MGDEVALAQAYRTIINDVSFDKFHRAYETSSLFPLVEKHGDHVPYARHLKDVLSGSPFEFKSVWYLKQAVMASSSKSTIIPSLTVDYGFINCADKVEEEQLKQVYAKYFSDGGDPLVLHDAAMAGSLYQCLRVAKVDMGKKDKKLFSRLMKTIYPLVSPAPDLL